MIPISNILNTVDIITNLDSDQTLDHIKSWLDDQNLTSEKYNSILEEFNCFLTIETKDNLNLNDLELTQLPNIFYDERFNRLKNLNLSENQLQELPESFRNLVNLEKLDLSYNQFQELPQSIGNLVKLKKLDFSENQLQQLPESFSNLVNLEKLDLSYNQFQELPQSIGNLVKLKKLDLSENQLQQLPESFSNLVNMKRLDLSYNQFQELPHSLGNLTKLQEFFFLCNNIEIIPHSIKNLPELENCDLSLNDQLTWFGESKDAITEWITHLLTEESIPIENCMLILKKINSFLRNESSNSLNLRGFRLNSLPDIFHDERFNQLRYFDLSKNKLQELPKSFEKLVKLKELDLSRNQLKKLPDSIEKLINLNTLDLSENLIQKLSDSIEKLINLNRLYLSNNLMQKLPESIGNLTKLKDFYLSYNNIQMIPDSIKELPNAHNFDLSLDDQLIWLGESKEAIIEWLIRLIKDQVIKDRDCITIFKRITSFLRNESSNSLNLRGFNLTSLPDIFHHKGFDHLMTLDLSNNQIQKLPESIGNLRKLKYFRFSLNYIQMIPDSIKELPNAHNFDLSLDNQLTWLGESNEAIIEWIKHLIKDQVINPKYCMTILKRINYFLRNESSYSLDLIGFNLDSLPNIFHHKNFNRLSILNVSNNQIQKLPESIRNLTNLTYLNLSNNQIEELPDSIGNLRKLNNFHFSLNYIQMIPDSIKELPNARNFDLSLDDQLTCLGESKEAIIEWVTHLIKDQVINIKDSIKILKRISSFLRNEYSYSLDLIGFNLDSLPNIFHHKNFDRLIILDLLNNQIQELPDSIGNLTNLKTLNLSNNQIQELPDSIGNLTNLKTLNLSNNQIQRLPNSIGNLTQLMNLFLQNNQIQRLPSSIINLNSLGELSILDNPISEETYSIAENLIQENYEKNSCKLFVIEEELEKNPELYLESIIEGIYEKKTHFKIEFENQIGQDVGGLTRVFLDQLFSSLINTNPFKKVDSSNLFVPISDLKIHQKIGQVLAWCQQFNLITGPQFDISIFYVISELMKETIEAPISNWDIRKKIPLYQILVKMQKDSSYSQLIEFISTKWDKQKEKEVQDYLTDVLCLEDVSNPRDALLKEAAQQFDPQLSGIQGFVIGMKKMYSKQLLVFMTSNPQSFESELQGECLERPDIAQSINYEGTNEEVIKKVTWLKNWIINSATDEEIKQMLCFFTGSSRLPKNKMLNVVEQIGDHQKPVPIAHTCYYQIDFASKPSGWDGFNDHTEENFIAALKATLENEGKLGFLLA